VKDAPVDAALQKNKHTQIQVACRESRQFNRTTKRPTTKLCDAVKTNADTKKNSAEDKKKIRI